MNQNHVCASNNIIPQFKRNVIQNNNCNDCSLGIQSQLTNPTHMSNFHSTNVNNMNSLQHIRSPTLQHAFDSIRLTAQNTMSSNDIQHNSRHSFNPNNYMQTMNDRNGTMAMTQTSV